VLGDNRDNSYDSRFYGAVGIDRLRAKPLTIYFSFGDSHVRWSRIGLRF
jgi:signal peptidase I